MFRFFFFLVTACFLIGTAACSENSSEQTTATKTTFHKTPLKPYPNAARVNLLVGDKAGEYAFEQVDLQQSSNPAGRDLTSSERVGFEKAINGITSKNADPDAPIGSAAACFIPHHFFRYYDTSGNKIGEISVCFCCGDFRANPELKESSQIDYVEIDIDAAEALVKKMNLPTDIACE